MTDGGIVMSDRGSPCSWHSQNPLEDGGKNESRNARLPIFKDIQPYIIIGKERPFNRLVYRLLDSVQLEECKFLVLVPNPEFALDVFPTGEREAVQPLQKTLA